MTTTAALITGLSTELVTAVFTGAALLLGAVTGLLTRKSSTDAAELRAAREELKARRAQERKFLAWSGDILRWASFHRHDLPQAPEGLFDDLAIDHAAADPPEDPDRGGAHRAP